MEPKNIVNSSAESPAQIPEIVDTKGSEIQRVEHEIKRFERFLSEQAPPELIGQLLLDICHAENIHRDQNGNEYRTPAWASRVQGLDRLLQARRFVTKEDTVPKPQVNKIVIQVIEAAKEPPKAISSQEEA